MVKFVWIFLFLFLAAATPASPYTIEVINTDSTRGGGVNFVVDGANYNGYAGAIFGRFDGGSETLTFFCVDLFTGISLGTYGTTPVTPISATAQARVAWLYENQLSTVTSANLGRGFQLAIWDIIHDGGDGVSAGRIRQRTGSNGTPAAVVTAWNNYLNVSLGQSSTNASIYRNFDLSSGIPVQDFIGPYQFIEGEIPEPSQWVLMATGAGVLAFRRFRRRRAPPPAA
ncbi:MAG: PEP-CTERM sorting domain-containing protein [Bryobacteraceae bacterium]|nr:PEP-CTERM sorting domain-containing protein [Bryobacteraceae bacterium]